MSIACSRMYDVTPQVKAAWTELFHWVSSESGVDLEVYEHKAPAPMEDLWSRTDIGCVFMCGWPFAGWEPTPKIVCAPILSSERYRGRPNYVTDFVVRKDGEIQTLKDCFGGRLGWTVDHSHSGYNAPRHHLQAFTSPNSRRLFGESIGPLVTPRAVIAALLEDRLDVGPLDGWFLDLLRVNEAETAEKLRVVDTTEPSPIPPLVAHHDISPSDLEKLRNRFIAAADAPALRPVLKTLLIKEFVVPNAGDYVHMLDWAESAVRAGYPIPA
jgi:ABC-type phosphate/phosphonate transport system substrate-binding protein